MQACLEASQPAGALVEVVGLAPASVSEHLRVLRTSGLLVLERRGRFRYYRTDPEALAATAAGVAALVRRPSGRP